MEGWRGRLDVREIPVETKKGVKRNAKYSRIIGVGYRFGLGELTNELIIDF